MSSLSHSTNPHAAALRRNLTQAERAIWFAVRDRRLGGFKLRRQVPVGPYIVNSLCVEARLVVETDGGQHTPEADARRTAEIEAQGFQVIRFWNNDVLANLAGVLQALHAPLLASLSPAGGRGPG